ncbi:MAG: hypothetical protein ABIP55_03775 [Tepidisphaeraceae bacterium]
MHVVDEEDRLLVTLWAQCRGGEVTGRIGGMAAGIIVSGPIGAILPETGGMLDQVNCTMESLAVIEAAFQALKPKPHEDGA